jgi:hypothetical protein
MRLITSRYAGKCRSCGKAHSAGEMVGWEKGKRGVLCRDCFNSQRGEISAKPETKSTKAPALPEPAEASDVLRWSIDWGELKEILSGYVKEGVSPYTHPNAQRTMENHLINPKISGFEGFSPGQVKEWLTSGFQSNGLEIGNFNPPLREKARLRFSEEGDEFHYDRAASGYDEYMSDWTKREAIPGIAFEANIMFVCTTDAKLVNAYNVWLCQAIYAIESMGIDSQVTLRFPSRGSVQGDSRMAETVIRVKRENEITDFAAWSPMLSPAAFRGFGFAAMALHAQARGKDVSHGYGRGHSGNAWKVEWDAERRILFADCPYQPRGDFPAEEMTRQLREALHAMHN